MNLLLEALVAVEAFVKCTCIEYFYHRYVAHRFEKTYHLAHHRGQIDQSRYTAWVVIASLIPITMFVPAGILRGLMIGSLSEVCLFMAIHYLFHSNVNVPMQLYARLKQHHKTHHKKPQHNFGVTTRIWDQLFETSSKASPRSFVRAAMTQRVRRLSRCDAYVTLASTQQRYSDNSPTTQIRNSRTLISKNFSWTDGFTESST